MRAIQQPSPGRSNKRGSPSRSPRVPVAARNAEVVRNMQTSVRQYAIANRPQNTNEAYHPKQLEFKQFCDYLYSNEAPQTRYLVSPEKTYIFLWYQAHRRKRSVRGKRRNKTEIQYFDSKEYNRLCEKDDEEKMRRAANPDTTVVPLDPEDPLGFVQVNSYKSALSDLWKEQHAENCNSYNWTNQICTPQLKQLLKMVQERKPQIDKRNHKEKVDHVIAPYYYVDKIPLIEKELWKHGNDGTTRSALGSLRNRYAFLQLHNALLRGESLHKADLSDLLSFEYQGGTDPHKMYILVLQLAIGKVNRTNKIFGRSVRHKDVALCNYGALGLYLMYRFYVTDEMDPPPDFTINSAWFDIKLLVPSTVNRQNNTSLFPDDTYGRAIKEVLKKLGILSTHFVHFGRKAAPTKLELDEVPADDIKRLGNWDIDIQSDAYSAKMPMRAMRAIGGHSPQKGCHYNPRVFPKPNPHILAKVFPWIEKAEESVKAAVLEDGEERFTALMFLRFMKTLRMVTLQDASMLYLDEERKRHPLFQMPIFQSQEWIDFQANHSRYVSTCTAPERLDTDLGVREYLRTLTQQQTMQTETVTRQMATVIQSNVAEHEVTRTMVRQVQDNFTDMFGRMLTGSLSALHNNTRRNDVPIQRFGQSLSQSVEPDGALADNSHVYSRNVQNVQRDLHLHFPGHFEHDTPAVAPAGYVTEEQFNGVHKMQKGTHSTFQSMWDEWHGVGNFLHIPCVGGIAELEKVRKTLWRRNNFSTAEQKHFSRFKQCINAAKLLVMNGTEEAEVIRMFNGLYAEANKSLTAFVKKLQDMGYEVKETKTIARADV